MVTAVDVALEKFSEVEASMYVFSRSPVTGLLASLDSNVGFFHASCSTTLARWLMSSFTSDDVAISSEGAIPST